MKAWIPRIRVCHSGSFRGPFQVDAKQFMSKHLGSACCPCSLSRRVVAVADLQRLCFGVWHIWSFRGIMKPSESFMFWKGRRSCQKISEPEPRLRMWVAPIWWAAHSAPCAAKHWGSWIVVLFGLSWVDRGFGRRSVSWL